MNLIQSETNTRQTKKKKTAYVIYVEAAPSSCSGTYEVKSMKPPPTKRRLSGLRIKQVLLKKALLIYVHWLGAEESMNQPKF